MYPNNIWRWNGWSEVWRTSVGKYLEICVNRITAIDNHDHQLFNELHCSLVTSPIFVHYQRLIARKIAELFGFNSGIWPLTLLHACSFDELGRGFVGCLLSPRFGKQFHGGNTWTLKLMTMVSVGAYGANTHPMLACLGIYWIGQCTRHCTGASLWPSKWPAKEVHLFVTAIFFVWLIVAK